MTTGSRLIVALGGALLVAAVAVPRGRAQQPTAVEATRAGGATPPPVSVVDATIVELRAALDERRITSREIVTQYLTRMALYEDQLHAALAVNRLALEEADELDSERRAGRIRGPLHGIPVAVKDNIHTTNMPTTGGASLRRTATGTCA